MTCITSFLDIPRFAVSLLTIISSTYFTCRTSINALFFLGKAFSYVIGFLPILCKKINTICLGTGSKRKSKLDSSRFPIKAGYQLSTNNFFSLGQFSYVRQLFLCLFSSGLSFATLTVAVSCGAENSAPGSMGINYQYPTTNFARTITLICFICSSCLAFYCCALINIRFLPLIFLKYYLMWRAPRDTGKEGREGLEEEPTD